MLKWNGIFLMKFIAMAHLLFNTFSVPSALLHYESWAFSVLEDHHAPLSYTFLRTSSNMTLALKENKYHVHHCFVPVHSHSDSLWDEHAARSKQQQCHVGSSCIGFCYHSVWQNRTQAGTGLGLWTIFTKSWSSFLLIVFVKSYHTLVSPGFGECGSWHPESYPYHPHSAHCWLLPED